PQEMDAADPRLEGCAEPLYDPVRGATSSAVTQTTVTQNSAHALALIGSCVVAAISPKHEAKIVVTIGAIALVLFLIHATIQGLAGALSRFHQH
ncbi:hypothetical protein, partial [Xanthomonas citri]|uniref:hypothetical protein n=3 Tax=Xanthomonas citri TaxID=346 RepID=UPI0018E304C9